MSGMTHHFNRAGRKQGYPVAVNSSNATHTITPDILKIRP